MGGNLLLSLIVAACVHGAMLRSPTYGEPSPYYQKEVGGYLPPREETSAYCKPSVVYVTKTEYSKYVVPSTLYNTDVKYSVRTEYHTEQVPSPVYQQLVSTQVVPQIKYQTVVFTKNLNNEQTQTVTRAPQVKYVTQTMTAENVVQLYSTVAENSFRQVPSAIVRDVVSSVVLPVNVVSTVYRTNTVTVTKQQPDKTKLVKKVQYKTLYSTVYGPEQTVYNTKTAFRVDTATRTQAGPPDLKLLTSTVLRPIVSTHYSYVHRTNTQTREVTITKDQTMVTTVLKTETVPRYVTRIVEVPEEVVKTHYSTLVIPTIVYDTQTVHTVIQASGDTEYTSLVMTQFQSEYLPGYTRTEYRTNTVYDTSYVTSTVYKRQVNTVVVTKTMQAKCGGGGYDYPTPATPYESGY